MSKLTGLFLLSALLVHGVEPLCGDEDVSVLPSRLGQSTQATVAALQEHVETLADDAFQGREAGKPGGHAAAGYILRVLKEYQLTPAGEGGTYFQPFGRGYRNIIAKIPATMDGQRDECLILSAHYDHVGLGSKSNSKGTIGSIHNGADDNASGVATVLEVAKVLSRAKTLRRPVVVIFWDAEEKGLLGSKHWFESPTFDVASVCYMINVDMVGRLRERLLLYGTRTMPGLRLAWSEANNGVGVSVDFPWEVINNSDHFTFFQKRIPVTMVHTGLHDDYHKSSDDVHLLNQDGMKQAVDLLVNVVLERTSQKQLPPFRDASLSEKSSAQQYYERPYRDQQRRIGLTVAPRAGGDGLQVDAVWGGSPASRAGLRPGSVVTSANGMAVKSAAQLRRQILKAGKNMALVVRENAESREAVIELSGKPQRIGFSWRTSDAEPGVVMLSGVVPDSAAALAGCERLDRVVEVNGRRVTDSSTFREEMENLAGAVRLLLERNGKLIAVTMDLADAAK